jgi:hypothetical protein
MILIVIYKKKSKTSITKTFSFLSLTSHHQKIFNFYISCLFSVLHFQSNPAAAPPLSIPSFIFQHPTPPEKHLSISLALSPHRRSSSDTSAATDLSEYSKLYHAAIGFD